MSKKPYRKAHHDTIKEHEESRCIHLITSEIPNLKSEITMIQMFEKYMIVENDAANIVENGKVTGFKFGARLPYYRGIALSMLDDVVVTIDGEAVPKEQIQFSAHGNTYTLKEMETETADRWNMGEVAYIIVNKEGGLPKGEHQIGLMLNMRIAYLPFPSIRNSVKTVVVA
jgi:hypothetical protein